MNEILKWIPIGLTLLTWAFLIGFWYSKMQGIVNDMKRKNGCHLTIEDVRNVVKEEITECHNLCNERVDDLKIAIIKEETERKNVDADIYKKLWEKHQ